jgi:hypothetical protein
MCRCGLPCSAHFREGHDVPFPMLPLVVCASASARRDGRRPVLVSFKVRCTRARKGRLCLCVQLWWTPAGYVVVPQSRCTAVRCAAPPAVTPQRRRRDCRATRRQLGRLRRAHAIVSVLPRSAWRCDVNSLPTAACACASDALCRRVPHAMRSRMLRCVQAGCTHTVSPRRSAGAASRLCSRTAGCRRSPTSSTWRRSRCRCQRSDGETCRRFCVQCRPRECRRCATLPSAPTRRGSIAPWTQRCAQLSRAWWRHRAHSSVRGDCVCKRWKSDDSCYNAPPRSVYSSVHSVRTRRARCITLRKS